MKSFNKNFSKIILVLVLIATFSSSVVKAEGFLQSAPTATATPITPIPSATIISTPTATFAPTATWTASATSSPTETPPPSATPDENEGAKRPILIIQSYTVKPEGLTVGKDFKLKINLRNEGTLPARNIILSFDASIFLPRQTGGILTVDNIYQDNSAGLKQVFTVSSAAENGANLLRATVSYTDGAGNAYSESYLFTLNVKRAWGGGVAVTKTPVPSDKPQLVITSYQTDLEDDHLQAGNQFTLTLQINNTGKRDARGVSMAIGGATSSGDQSSGGNDQAGNASVSMSGGDFSRFAPIGASNVQTLGTISAGASLQVSQRLIVGVGTEAGAYPFKISFVYTDKNGRTIIDDQVITLIVYAPPTLEIGFYQELDDLTVGQVGNLPLQVVNLGKKTVILGHITLLSGDGVLEKNTATIGSIGAGDFYSLDALFTPSQAGKREIKILIEYKDYFNNPQVVEQTLQVNVQELPEFSDEEGMDDFSLIEEESQPLTIWQRIGQFFSGLFGLDSGSGA